MKNKVCGDFLYCVRDNNIFKREITQINHGRNGTSIGINGGYLKNSEEIYSDGYRSTIEEAICLMFSKAQENYKKALEELNDASLKVSRFREVIDNILIGQYCVEK